VNANVNLNVDSNRVRAQVVRGAVDVMRNIELVLDANVYGVGEVDVSGSGDYAMSPNEGLSGSGVCKNTCVGAGCCPTDSLCPSGVRTGHAVGESDCGGG
jgi:hypothetical protein